MCGELDNPKHLPVDSQMTLNVKLATICSPCTGSATDRPIETTIVDYCITFFIRLLLYINSDNYLLILIAKHRNLAELSQNVVRTVVESSQIVEKGTMIKSRS